MAKLLECALISSMLSPYEAWYYHNLRPAESIGNQQPSWTPSSCTQYWYCSNISPNLVVGLHSRVMKEACTTMLVNQPAPRWFHSKGVWIHTDVGITSRYVPLPLWPLGPHIPCTLRRHVSCWICGAVTWWTFWTKPTISNNLGREGQLGLGFKHLSWNPHDDMLPLFCSDHLSHREE